MTDKLTCLVCNRSGFLRLQRHLNQIHKMSAAIYCNTFPGASLEILSTRKPTCLTCGVVVEGYNPRAANVKCDACRITPPSCKIGTEDPSLVTCQICGLSRRRLGKHLEKKHSTTPADYKTLYPNSLIEVPGTRARSDSCRAKMTVAAKARWTDPDERAAQSVRLKKSAPWKGKHMTLEHRAAISLGGTDIRHTLTSEQKKQQGIRGKRSLEAIRLRPGHSDRLAEAGKRRYKRAKETGVKIGFYDPEIRRKSLATRTKNGTLAPQGSGRGICGFRQGISHYCRSTLEANFSRVLLHFGIHYRYEPNVFKLSSGTSYTPDFFLLESLSKYSLPMGWIELKGWRKPDGSVATQAKIDTFVKDYGTSILVLAEKDPLWIKITSEVKPLIPLWETPNRNLRSHPQVFGLPAIPSIESVSKGLAAEIT